MLLRCVFGTFEKEDTYMCLEKINKEMKMNFNEICLKSVKFIIIIFKLIQETNVNANIC